MVLFSTITRPDCQKRPTTPEPLKGFGRFHFQPREPAWGAREARRCLASQPGALAKRGDASRAGLGRSRSEAMPREPAWALAKRGDASRAGLDRSRSEAMPRETAWIAREARRCLASRPGALAKRGDASRAGLGAREARRCLASRPGALAKG